MKINSDVNITKYNCKLKVSNRLVMSFYQHLSNPISPFNNLSAPYNDTPEMDCNDAIK